MYAFIYFSEVWYFFISVYTVYNKHNILLILRILYFWYNLIFLQIQLKVKHELLLYQLLDFLKLEIPFISNYSSIYIPFAIYSDTDYFLKKLCSIATIFYLFELNLYDCLLHTTIIVIFF